MYNTGCITKKNIFYSFSQSINSYVKIYEVYTVFAKRTAKWRWIRRCPLHYQVHSTILSSESFRSTFIPRGKNGKENSTKKLCYTQEIVPPLH